MPSGWREGEKEKRPDLVFYCCPPPHRPAPLRSSPLWVCLYGYRQTVFTQHSSTGGPRNALPAPFSLDLHPSSSLALCSLLDHHVLPHPFLHSLHPILLSCKWCRSADSYGSTGWLPDAQASTSTHDWTWKFMFFWLTVTHIIIVWCLNGAPYSSLLWS